MLACYNTPEYTSTMNLWRLLTLLALAFTLISSCALSDDKPKQDYWMGVYYGKSKIGSYHVVLSKDTTDQSAGWLRSENLIVRFKTSGKTYSWTYSRTVHADSMFGPISEDVGTGYKDSTMSADDMTLYQVKFGVNEEKITAFHGQETYERKVPLDDESRSYIAKGCSFDLGGTKLSVGQRFDVYHMIPEMSILPKTHMEANTRTNEVCVLRRESITVGGSAYQTLVLSERGQNNDIVTWLTDDGEIVKREMPKSHLLWLRQSKTEAPLVEGEEALVQDVAKAEIPKDADKRFNGKSPAPLDYWLGVYVKSVKMGDLHVVAKPTKLDGKDVFCKEETLRTRVNDDKHTDVEMIRRLYADSQFRPILETLDARGTDEIKASKPASRLMSCRYGADSTSATVTNDGKDSTHSAPFSDEDKYFASTGCAYDFGVCPLTAGNRLDLHHTLLKFEPGLTSVGTTTKSTSVVVLPAEKLDIDGVTYDTVVVSETDESGYTTTTWQKASGEIVKMDVRGTGVTLRQETKEQASSKAN